MRLANASEKMRRWSMVQTKIGEVWQLCTVSDLYAVAAQFFELLVFAVSASQMCLKPSPRLSPPKAHKWNVQTLNGKLLGTARCINEQSHNIRSLHDRQSPLQSKQIRSTWISLSCKSLQYAASRWGCSSVPSSNSRYFDRKKPIDST